MTCEDPACSEQHEPTAKYALPIVLFKDETSPTYTAAINQMVQNLLTDCGANMKCAITTNQSFYDHINKAAREWVALQEGDGPFITSEIVFDAATEQKEEQ